VTLKFTTPAVGRSVGGRCLAPSRLRARRRRCTRALTAGMIVFAAHSGTNRVRFEGRISTHRRLAPGSYTLLLSAAAAGERSRTGTLHFTIARG